VQTERVVTRADDRLVEQATALLRSVGQRVTKPRVALLAQIIDDSGSHLSADVLHDRVAGVEPTIHRATVYRTLEGLTTVGVLRHVHLDRGLTAYHLVDRVVPAARHSHDAEHLHAQCSQCGQVTDLPADVLGDTGERIRRASGFRLDASHVALSGRCASCVAAAAD
jgi:Fur family transcriptional regulator, ferric uptake regulator